MTDKIINTFQQRRQLTQELAYLAETTTEGELLEGARQIVHTYPHDLVLPLLLRSLDTPSSQLRGGLGHIAALLPGDEVRPALRAAATNRDNAPQARVAAALILERFLGEELSPSLLNDLNDTNEIAYQSLQEAVEEGAQNRHVLLEYVTQMRETDEEIAFVVMDLLGRLSESNRVELLRLIAQDDRPTVAAAALARLEALGSGVAKQNATRALHTLQFTLPPDLAQHAGRNARKLQFGGAGYTPSDPSGWVALLSPVDMAGVQVLWFARTPATTGDAGALLGLVVDERYGLLHAFGSESMRREDLPAVKDVGQMVSVKLGDGNLSVMLQVSFDHGRWLLQKVLDAHWQQTPSEPVPAEYRLYNDLIWQYDAPEVDEELRSFYEQMDDREMERREAPELEKMATALLEHPVMLEWDLSSRLSLKMLNPNTFKRTGLNPTQMAAVVLREMDTWRELDSFRLALASGLRGQAAWLHAAGELAMAQQALTLANHTALLPPSQNPLVVQLMVATMEAYA